ncbi:LCP family protein [Ammoniphilus resinae]|nr:LCP family protein [Ammoniphilus resinae]
MKKLLLMFFSLVLLVGLGFAGYGYVKYQNMVERWYMPLEPGEYAGEKKNKPPAEEKVELAPFTVLLLGVDSREGEKKSRSDTIMLAAVHPKNQKAVLMSIPRDTLADIPGYGQDKFNHSMFYGGPPLVKQTMENFFDIKVDHYAAVDFDGFIKIVDALGGVEVNVKRRMKYHDPVDGTSIDLQPGLQLLDGENALDYARFRKSDIGSAASDFDRMDRQQEIIRKIADKATELSSVFKVFKMMDILGEHVKTDFTEEKIRGLFLQFRNFSSSSIKSVEIQGTNRRIPMHGYNLWFYLVDQEERNRIKTIIEDTLAGSEPNVTTAK